jgi:hypothetical protein
MYNTKLAALTCGLALFASAKASQSIQEINTKIEIFAAGSGGVFGGRISQPQGERALGAFRSNGLDVGFKVPGALTTEVLGMNGKNEMVGSANPGGQLTAFHRSWKGKVSKYVYPGANMTAFNDIDDKGNILGWQYTDLDSFGSFILDKNGQTTPLLVPGFEDGNWYRLNNQGQILGSSSGTDPFLGIVALLYGMDKVEIIKYPEADYTLAIDLNNSGDVLGEAWMPYDPTLNTYPTLAFIRRSSGEMVPLDYQPNWAPFIREKVNGKYMWLKFAHVEGTSARALDESGRAIIVSRALYLADTPFGSVGAMKERVFAIRP